MDCFAETTSNVLPLGTNNVSLADYDLVLINSSAGKDSQSMLDLLVAQADAEGVDRSRLVVVHADLGRVEWEGTRELAEAQAAHYGLRFEVTRARDKDGNERDLLTQVEDRHAALQAKGKVAAPWPSSAARYCTSDQKRGPVKRVITALTTELQAAGIAHPRILNCLGIRAQESAARAKKESFTAGDKTFSNTKRTVDTWFPIFTWSVEQVWARIAQSGVAHHPAYDIGMPRLSCVFCVLAPKSALVLAAQHNPELAKEYEAVEQRTGFTFQNGLSISEVIAEAETADAVVAEDWAA